MGILTEICDRKRVDLVAREERMPMPEIMARAAMAPPCRGFLRRLREVALNENFAVIAEIKRASPSKGVIRQDFDPAGLAAAYQDGGAACLSVLTDTPYFEGANAHLLDARSNSAIPILRKDFILSPYQVYESRALGADALLLIMAALSDAMAGELLDLATRQGMDVLVEVHDRTEMERALALEAKLIGINNRDLGDFSVDLAVTETLAPLAQPGVFLVSESGIQTPDDVKRVRAAGARAVLVGESLMRQTDVAAALRQLRKRGA